MSSHAQILAGLAAVIVVGGATAGALHVHQQQQQAQAAQVQQTRIEVASDRLERDVASHTEALADPARDARDAAAALRILIAETVTGWEHDDDKVRANLDRRLEQLRAAADELDAASRPPVFDGRPVLATAATQPVVRQLEALEAQAGTTAEVLRDSADTAETIGMALHDLHVAATAFVTGADDLPERDDPEGVAEAWRDELERLEPYREAAENAAGTDAIAELAAAHLQLVEDLETSGETALDHLEAGDVDAYNEHRETELETAAALHDVLVEAMERTLPQAVSRVEVAEEHVLGLLNEIERLRRTAPTQLAELRAG